MNDKALLVFDEKEQTFFWNEHRLKSIDFRSRSLNGLFKENCSYTLIKNFIDKDIALRIKEYYTQKKMRDVFYNVNSTGNDRIFYYLNSPYQYPQFIKSLIMKIMEFKNKFFIYTDFYHTYCMVMGLNPKHFEKVACTQSLHSWQAVYWYKNGQSHFKHIDNYGELATFLILSELGKDYSDGGLKLYYQNEEKVLDDLYNYGDLCLFDQSKLFHEVVPIKVEANQVGRLQLYVPTIPLNYMQETLVFENYPNRKFYTRKQSIYTKIMDRIRPPYVSKDIHYSRKEFKHYEYTL